MKLTFRQLIHQYRILTGYGFNSLMYYRRNFLECVDEHASDVLYNWTVVYYSKHVKKSDKVLRQGKLLLRHYMYEIAMLRAHNLYAFWQKPYVRKSLEKAFYEWHEYNDVEEVAEEIQMACTAEGFPDDYERRKTAARIFVKQLPKIIDAICNDSKSYDIIGRYINTI